MLSQSYRTSDQTFVKRLATKQWQALIEPCYGLLHCSKPHITPQHCLPVFKVFYAQCKPYSLNKYEIKKKFPTFFCERPHFYFVYLSIVFYIHSTCSKTSLLLVISTTRMKRDETEVKIKCKIIATLYLFVCLAGIQMELDKTYKKKSINLTFKNNTN